MNRQKWRYVISIIILIVAILMSVLYIIQKNSSISKKAVFNMKKFNIVKNVLMTLISDFEAERAEKAAEEPGLPDVMDYSGRWGEIAAGLGMTPITEEYSMGDVYDWNGFHIDIAEGNSDYGEYVTLRSNGCCDISIGGAVVGDKKTYARERLRENSWMCISDGAGEASFVTERDGNGYYLALYYSQQDGSLEDWYMNNWPQGEFFDFYFKGYEAYRSVSDPWRKAYIEFIIEKASGDYDYNRGRFLQTFRLVDIDGGIPELYIDFGTTAGGSMVCAYYNDSVVSQYVWNGGLSYLEGKNLFMDFGGHQYMYHNKIYSIENGEFVLRYDGEFGAMDNPELKTDENGSVLYDYYWDGTKVSSKEEYRQLIASVFDDSLAVHPYDAGYDDSAGRYTGFCGHEEIFQAIAAY